MAKKRLARTILIILVGIFLLIQFFGINRSVPPTDPALDLMAVTQPPERIEYLIHQGCYDCHSYETEYPWYAYVEPVSWFLQSHITEAREHMNFSEWGNYSMNQRQKKFEHAARMVKNRKMPLWSFRIEHPEARLTDGQIDTLSHWFSMNEQKIGE